MGGAEKTEASAMRTAARIEAAFACPRTWCRGRLHHSRLVHWFGWVLR